MKNAYQVLTQKEAEMARIRQEIESLKVVAPLLADEGASSGPSDTPLPNDLGQSADALPQSSDGPDRKPPAASETEVPTDSDSEATGTEGPLTTGRRRGFWSALKPRR
jgi:hypothetical protein